MKWIRALERLPDEKWLGCVRGDGGGCYHHETNDRQGLIMRLKEDEDAHHKYDPEWLDQTICIWDDADMLNAYRSGYRVPVNQPPLFEPKNWLSKYKTQYK